MTVDGGGSIFLRADRFGRPAAVVDDPDFFARVDFRRVAGSVTRDEFSSPVVVLDAVPFSPAACPPLDDAGSDAICASIRTSVSEEGTRSMETNEGEDMGRRFDARIPPKPATRLARAQGDTRDAPYPRRV